MAIALLAGGYAALLTSSFLWLATGSLKGTTKPISSTVGERNCSATDVD